MPYDPRMLQMAQMGVGMMGPPPFGADARNQPQRPKQWWEQPMPMGKSGGGQSPQDDPSKPDDPNAPKQPQPSLLQMLMLGGPATYSGTPKAGAGGASPWGWLGSMGLSGGAGWGGGGTPG
jgi:hypothetical protein